MTTPAHNDYLYKDDPDSTHDIDLNTVVLIFRIMPEQTEEVEQHLDLFLNHHGAEIVYWCDVLELESGGQPRYSS